jgi:hypothetical protein
MNYGQESKDRKETKAKPTEPASGPLKPPHGGAIVRMYLSATATASLSLLQARTPTSLPMF